MIIYNGQYSIKIHIYYKDKELINQFLKYIKSTNTVKLKKGKYPSYYVSLTSKHMCESLMKYGIVPRKTDLNVSPKAFQRNLKEILLEEFLMEMA